MKRVACDAGGNGTVLARIVQNLALAALTAAGPVTALGDVAVNFNGESPNPGNAYANGVGLVFTVGSQNLQVSALAETGYIDDWNDVTHSSANLNASPLTLKLWRVSDGALLASTTVNSSNYSQTWLPNGGSYMMPYLTSALSAVRLVNGVQYQVALYGTSSHLQYINNLDSAAIKPVVSSAITVNKNRYANVGGYIMCNTDDTGTTPRYGGPTFEFTTTGAASLRWNSSSSSVWDTRVTANWLNQGATYAEVFAPGDNVTFDDTAGLQTSVTIGTAVQPGSVTVNSAANNYAFSGAGGIGGAGTLLKSGNSTLTLNGANSFSGGLTISGGKVVGAATGSLGSGTVNVNSGGTLSWTANGYNSFPSLTLNIVGGTVSLDSASNNAHNYASKTVTLQGGTLTSVNGLGGLANDGGYGNFILNNSTLAVSGSAQSTISCTTFQTGGASTFNVGATGAATDLLLASVVSGGAISKTGAGKMVLSGNNTYAGGTLVNGGTLSVAHIADSGTSNIGIVGGTGNYLAIYTGTLEYTGAGSDSSTRSLWIDQGNTKTAAIDITQAAGQLTLTPGTGTINANLVKAGAGTLTLNAAISASGSVAVNAGTLILGTAGTYNGGTAVNGGTLAPAAGSLGSGTVTLGGGTFKGWNAATFANAVAINSAAGNAIDTGYGSWYLNGNISGGGAVSKTSANRLHLGGDNSGYGGTFTEVAGNVKFTTATAGSAGAQWAMNGSWIVFGLAGSGTVDFGALSGSASVYNDNANTTTMRVGALGTDTSYAGVIQTSGSNPIALNKVGGGKLTLTAASGYSGGTTVNGGTLSLATGGYNALNQAAAVAIGGGATLSADQPANNAHNIGALTLTGGTLTSANGPAGPANDGGWGNFILRGVTVGGSAPSTISATTIQISSGSFTVADAAAGTDLLVSSAIAAGAVTKDGAGTLALSGANTYAGATTINAGTLQVGTGGASGTLGTAGVVNNATLAFNRSDASLTVANAISGAAGAVRQDGIGSTTLSSASNSYGGGTTVNAGKLLVATGSGTGTGAVQVNAAGTLGGSGQIAGAVVVAGTVSPGMGGVGTLTVNNTLTLQENSACTWESNTSAADLVQVNGDIVLPAVMNVSASGDLPSAGPAVVFRWTGNRTGASDLSGWSVSYGLRAHIVGNEVHLDPKAGTVFTIR